MILKISVGKCNFSNYFLQNFQWAVVRLVFCYELSRLELTSFQKIPENIFGYSNWWGCGKLCSVCISIIWGTMATQTSSTGLSPCLLELSVPLTSASSERKRCQRTKLMFSLWRKLTLYLWPLGTWTGDYGWRWGARPDPPPWGSGPWSGRERRGSPGQLPRTWH